MKVEFDTTNYLTLFDLRGQVVMPRTGEVVELQEGATLTLGEIVERRGRPERFAAPAHGATPVSSNTVRLRR
jgi:hypothetical protein